METTEQTALPLRISNQWAIFERYKEASERVIAAKKRADKLQQELEVSKEFALLGSKDRQKKEEYVRWLQTSIADKEQQIPGLETQINAKYDSKIDSIQSKIEALKSQLVEVEAKRQQELHTVRTTGITHWRNELEATEAILRSGWIGKSRKDIERQIEVSKAIKEYESLIALSTKYNTLDRLYTEYNVFGNRIEEIRNTYIPDVKRMMATDIYKKNTDKHTKQLEDYEAEIQDYQTKRKEILQQLQELGTEVGLNLF